MVLFTAEETDNYDKLYDHSPFGYIGSYGSGSTTFKFSNVYTSAGDESIQAVGFYTNEAGAEYTINVYKNPDSGPVNTTAGSLSTRSGTAALAGYHTVKLTTPVDIQSGDKFSVVIEITNPEYIYPAVIEYNVANYLTQATSARGQSYYYNGASWLDLYDWNPSVSPDFCIKAYTEDHTVIKPAANFTAEPLSGKAPLTVRFNDRSENAPTAWSWNFGDGNSSTVQNPVYTYPDTGVYNVSLTVTNAGGSDSMEKSGYITVTDVETGTKYEYSSVIGGRGTGEGQFILPTGVAADSGDYIYVVDLFNNRVQKFSPDKTFAAMWGSFGTGDGQFNITTGIAADPDDNIYVADMGNSRVQKFDSNGSFIRKWGSEGTGDGQFKGLYGIASDKDGNIYVTDIGNSRVQKFDSDGNFITKWGSLGINDTEFLNPTAITVDDNGDVYVTDSQADQTNYVKKFTSDGVFITKWGGTGTSNGKFNIPVGIASDSAGNIFVSDKENRRVQIFTPDGGFLAKFGHNGSGPGEFQGLSGLALNSENYLYVADALNHRIEIFYPNGTAPLLPAADFTADITSGTVPLIVNFTDSSQNTPTSWDWDFGDGNSSTAQNPVYTYPDTGVYNVTLSVSNAYGSDSLTKNYFINVTGTIPDAELDFNRNNVALEYNDSFIPGTYAAPVTYRPHVMNYDEILSLGNISETAYLDNITGVEYGAFATWNSSYVQWNFPSDIAIGPVSGLDTRIYTSTSEDIFYNHTLTRTFNETVFTSAGVQHVNLTVNFGDTDFESVCIGLWPAKDLNCTGMIINSSFATNAPVQPIISYNHLGLDKNGIVTGYDYYFSYDIAITPNASAVTHKPMVYVWEGIEHEKRFFSGGYTTIDLPADMLAYDAHSFSVTTNTSCDWTVETQDNYLSVLTGESHAVSLPAPVADFTANVTSGTAPLSVQFNDTSANTPTAWTWEFGDGNTSAAANPAYTYPDAGVYNVTLTVSNAGGTDSEIKYGYINVTDVVSDCASAELDLNRNNVVLNYNDSFSTGTYAAPVTYRPHIQNYDENYTLGNVSVAGAVDNITGVDYEAFASWNSSYAEWNFPEYMAINPGEGFDTRIYTSTTEYVFYNSTITRTCNDTVFTSPGVQHVNLTVNFGDKDFESVFIGLWPAKDLNVTGMIVNGSVTTDAPLDPEPDFSGNEHLRLDKNALVTGYDYYFSYDVTIIPNASLTAVVHKPMAYIWEGIEHETDIVYGTKTLNVPADMLAYDAHAFSVTTNTTCNWTAKTQDNYLSVLTGESHAVALPAPVADFSANVTSGKMPLVVQFTDLSTGSPSEWSWSFGDGDTSAENNPEHIYDSAGTYNVSLTVTNAAGSDTETKNGYIAVYAPKEMPELIIPEITLGWGNSTVIPVMVTNMTNGTGISGTFTWDSSVIRVTSVAANSTVFSGSVVNTNISGNSAIITLTNTDEMSANDPAALFDISVTAAGSNGDKSYISGNDTYWSDTTFDRLDLACRDGFVEISGVKGDFNANGFVDIGDVSKVAYMVAGKTAVDMRADFNGNGEVDVGDAAKIAWFFIGTTGDL
jgi:PKD repeat protein